MYSNDMVMHQIVDRPIIDIEEQVIETITATGKIEANQQGIVKYLEDQRHKFLNITTQVMNLLKRRRLKHQ